MDSSDRKLYLFIRNHRGVPIASTVAYLPADGTAADLARAARLAGPHRISIRYKTKTRQKRERTFYEWEALTTLGDRAIVFAAPVTSLVPFSRLQ